MSAPNTPPDGAPPAGAALDGTALGRAAPASSATDSLRYTRLGAVVTITLHRPDQRNSMTPELLAAFDGAIARVREEKDLRVLVLRGSGNTFCGGADFRRSNVPRGAGRDIDLPTAQEQSFQLYRPFLEVGSIEVPTIAAMNGHAIGGGLGLAMMCDIRIANADAFYGANFARLGIHAGMASTYLLPRLVGLPRAAELLFSGRLISGTEAAAWGLANRAVPASEVLSTAEAIAADIASCAPLAVQMMKRSLHRACHFDPKPTAEYEAWLQSITWASADSKEGIAALLEKRPPQFQGR